MSYFMVLTSAQNWGVGDDLATAKRNARYRKRDHNALVLEWDKEPSDWNIDMWGGVTWKDANILEEYELHKPKGDRVGIRSATK
jgi:hypothetical protein